MNHLRANAVALAIGLLCLVGYLPFAPVRFYDFRAFYCAGKAIAVRADPYREHPLRECERDTSAPGMSVDPDDATVPVPLPGYILAIFAMLSVLPFGLCAVLWIVGSIAALIVSIELLRRVICLPLPTIAVPIFLPAAVVAIPLGQSAPFVSCAIAICAFGLRFGRPRLAAVGALATALDPSVALVLCATLVVAVPATRATIVLGTVALAGIALLTLGADNNLEYIHSVLHAHAIGNIAERSQFSTTHFAWVGGLDSNAALALGELWYACSALGAVLIAIRLRSTYGAVALALVPPAFAVFGGVYVHFSQLVLAIPAYLMALRPSLSAQVWLPAAIFILAVPWLALTAFPPFALALVALAIAYLRDIREPKTGLRLGLGSAALLLVFFGIALATVRLPAHVFHTRVSQNPLAESAWSQYVAWRDPKPSRLFLLLQLPTLVAFCVCLGNLCSAAAPSKQPGSVAVVNRWL